MADAHVDGNHVPVLMATSDADGITPIPVYATAADNRLKVAIPVLSGSGAPASTPVALGRTYIDTNAAKVYISTGTSSSADWSIVN